MIFDTHIHFFPDKLKDKVFPKLSKIANCEYHRDETLDSAMEFNSKMGGTHALALHIATNPTQQTAVNNFAYSCESDNLINFGSVHLKSENPISELKRIKEMGLKGIKLHPDYQEFFVDSAEMESIYRECEKLGLIITFHAGKDPYSPNIIHSTPASIKTVANSFPNLTIIAAHMGGMEMFDQCLSQLAGTKNVYFDTAFASSFLNTENFQKLVLAHGIDKILFATDAPWSTIEKERKLIDSTSLTSQDLEKIYFKNAMNLLF